MWILAALGSANLHSGEASVVQLVLICVGAVSGVLTGKLIVGHRSDPRAALFGATAGAVLGALCGAAYALVMGIAYVSSFGGTPVSLTDGLLVALSFPVFAALGALVGTLLGSALGAFGGFLVSRGRSAPA